MQKTYLSRAVTRAMSADHPVGDPTGGPAYGEKRDPISAVIAIGSMVGEYAAAGSFAAMTLTQGVVFAGAALNLVGNVTGNKTIQKLGMVVGIAGGITQLSNKLFDTGIGTSTLGEAFRSSPMEPFDTTIGKLGSPPTVPPAEVGGLSQSASRSLVKPEVVVPDAAVGNAIPNVNIEPVNAASGAATRGLEVSAPPSLQPSTLKPGSTEYRLAEGGTVSSSPAVPAPAVEAPVPRNISAPAAPAPGGINPANYFTNTGTNVPDSGVKESLARMAAQKPPGIIDMAKAGNYSGAISQVGSNAMDTLKNNPTGAYVAAQAVGAAANYLSGKTEAELNALKARTGYENAAALKIQAEIDREKQRRVNLNAGYGQVNTAMSTNPGVTMNGLIANARPAA